MRYYLIMNHRIHLLVGQRILSIFAMFFLKHELFHLHGNQVAFLLPYIYLLHQKGKLEIQLLVLGEGRKLTVFRQEVKEVAGIEVTL